MNEPHKIRVNLNSWVGHVPTVVHDKWVPTEAFPEYRDSACPYFEVPDGFSFNVTINGVQVAYVDEDGNVYSVTKVA